MADPVTRRSLRAIRPLWSVLLFLALIAAVIAAGGRLVCADLAAAVATGLTGLVVLHQLGQQARTEAREADSQLTAEYRAILKELNVESILGGSSDRLSERDLNAFYRYFDLCGQQIDLYNKALVDHGTYAEWRSGILNNLRKKARFAFAYKHIVWKCQTDFSDLIRLVNSQSDLSHLHTTQLGGDRSSRD